MLAVVCSYYLLIMFQNSLNINCLLVIIIIIIASPSFIYTAAVSHMPDRDSSLAVQWRVQQLKVTFSILYNPYWMSNPLYMGLLVSHKYDSPPQAPVALYKLLIM